jgi:hypothetical protein
MKPLKIEFANEARFDRDGNSMTAFVYKPRTASDIRFRLLDLAVEADTYEGVLGTLSPPLDGLTAPPMTMEWLTTKPK